MTPGPFKDLIDDGLGRVIDRGGGFYDVVIERRIRKPVEKVWAALTIPARIRDWFTDVELDLRLGGRYALSFPEEGSSMDGVIVEYEPRCRLAHTWPDKSHPDSIVLYELEPDGEGCRLTLTQTALPGKYSGSVAAGWHTFLEALPGAAEGLRTLWTAAREAEVRDRYRPQTPPA